MEKSKLTKTKKVRQVKKKIKSFVHKEFGLPGQTVNST
jgi:hypothetical protein